MSNNDIKATANANFHHVAGECLFASDDVRFQEYRDKWRRWPQELCVGEFPLFIDIEVTSVCNLKCPFCATTYRGDEIKKGFMPFDTLKKIINEGAKNNLYGVKFNIRGEPLLHSEIVDFVKYAKSKGLIDVYFNTNAMLLTEEVAKKLIDAGLNRLSVSFEGYTKDIFEKNRVGAKYETVLANIDRLQELKRELGAINPKLRVQTVMLPEVEAIFDQYKEFWSNRADEVAFLDYKEMKKKKKGMQDSWVCPQVWQRMAIFWDGTMLPCNHDDDGLLALGNVNNISIKEAWNSKKSNEIRELHRQGQAHKISACDGCYLRDSEIAKLKGEE